MTRDRRLDHLFERFRTRGDVEALGRLFDEAAPELYRVAVHLARDLHTAEDLVQTTFLAAIEARARWDRERSVLPWMLGILARKAAYARRADARSIEADRLAPRSTSEPAREAEGAELRALLDDKLARIPSPYREVLVAHLAEEQSAQEIARNLGRAPGTVRVQLHRGLAMLRERLPAGLATAGAIAIAPPSGWSAVRAVVLREAHVSIASLAPVTTLAPAVIVALSGGTLMITKMAWSVAFILVGLAVWTASVRGPVTLPGSVEGKTASRVETPAVDARDSSPAVSDRQAVPHSPTATAAAAASSVAAGAGWILDGTITIEPGFDVTATEIAVLPAGGPYTWPAGLKTRGRPDEHGFFRLDVSALFEAGRQLVPFELVVRADHPECMPVENRIPVLERQRSRPEAGGTPWVFESRFALSIAARVIGRLVLEDGNACADCDVGLLPSEGSKPSGAPIDAVRTTDGGNFLLRTPRSGSFLVLALRDRKVPLSSIVSAELGRPTDLGDLRLDRGAGIRGSVDLVGVERPDNILVLASPDVRGEPYRFLQKNLRWSEGRFLWDWSIETRTTAGGQFAFEGLARESYTVSLGDVPGEWLAMRVSATVTAPSDGVELRVPLARLTIRALSNGKLIKNTRISVQDVDPGSGASSMPTDADGRCRWLVRPAHRFVVRAGGEGYRVVEQSVDTPGPGEEKSVRIDLVPFAAAIAVRLAAVDGSDFDRVGFALISDLGSRSPGPGTNGWGMHEAPGAIQPDVVRNVTVAAGVFLLEGLQPGPHTLFIRAEGDWENSNSYWYLDPIEVDLVDGRTTKLDLSLRLGGRLRAESFDAQGDRVEGQIRIRPADGHPIAILVVTAGAKHGVVTSADRIGIPGSVGPSEVHPNLAPGLYELEVSASGRQTVTTSFTIEPGITTERRIVLDPE